jgi:RNA polymerase sigma-70 factor (ECF subfamily)
MSKVIKLDYADTHRNIVEECKRGNRQAQFELYRLYSKAMYNICLRMVKSKLDAEDILQSSFVDVFSKLDTFKFQSSVGAWIKRIVINNCINHLKRKKIYFEELQPQHANILDEPMVEDEKLNVEFINQAIYELPDGYRIVFTLYLLEGYDHKEIAHILSISEATSKSQYSRAKKKIREIIKTKRFRKNGTR